MTNSAAVGLFISSLVLPFVAPAPAPAGTVTAPTYSKQVAPIIFKNCLQCHRPEGIASSAPFLSYQDVRPRAKAIKEKVLLREMPPWPADPARSVAFRNDARLSTKDIETLAAWVDAGAPQGDAANTPAPPQFASGWQHPDGKAPDLVISLPGYVHVPAAGEIPYLRFLVKVPRAEDTWISAIQTRPSNSTVVHHMAITEVELDKGLSPTDLDAFASVAKQMKLSWDINPTQPAVTPSGIGDGYDMLGIYTPGSTIELYENDSAKLLKGGENYYINFNIHYQPTGKPETDRSQVAFWFRDSPPKRQLYRLPGAVDTIIANGKELLLDVPGKKAEGTDFAIPPIPANAGNYELIGIKGFVTPVTVYQLHPHAHLRAKSFQYVAVYPDGREETLLTVPKYDFRWQLAYDLKTPLTLPAGSKMVVIAHYDNSANNKFNPAPDKEVYFREQNQSWDEMFSPFIQYSIDSEDVAGSAKARHVPEPGRPNGYEIGAVVGCLARSAMSDWKLTSATDAVPSPKQATSSMELKAATGAALGDRQYKLVGAGVFNPSNHEGEKVAVKGVLIPGEEKRLNVTSLQVVAGSCSH